MFDPYHRWLGIAKHLRPPTFYQILGIAPDETDAEVIAEAALRQTSHVRTYQTGPHAALCTSILNEIAQAKATLLNPARRREYDALLARKNLASAEPPPLPAEVPDSPEIKPVEGSVEGITQLLQRSRLLTPPELDALRRCWQREATDPADRQAFTRWLVSNRYLTDYQLATLLGGHADRFFLRDYKLLDRIGRGRLAMVYKAVHRLGQVVAIKVLPRSRARDPGTLAQFRREAEVVCRLEHTNVVRGVEAGEDDGLHFLVTEYLEGETLQQLLDRAERLSVQTAAWIALQVFEGLAYLHTQNLVHRNLEPANLMLVGTSELSLEDPYQPTVKILDFSLSSSGDDPVAVHGLGNSAYMAPEQIRDAHHVDIRSDIYSVGSILYHMLAGRPPFAEMIQQATQLPIPLIAINPAVPVDLAQIVGWIMARDPGQRYQTPEQAAAALRAFYTAVTASVVLEPVDTHLTAAGRAARTVEEEFAAVVSLPNKRTRKERGAFDRRDLFFLLLGAIGALVAQAVGRLLGWWMSDRET